MRTERTIVVMLLALIPWVFCLEGVGSTEDLLPNAPNPAAVEQVKSGQRAEANAAWWGFNAEDSTECLQAAIDSGVRKLVVPYMGREWVVRPLKLRGNLEIVFEPGVVVLAKKGEFKEGGDSLFSASDASDITLRGYGAALRMRKKDYQNEPYKKAEWRMVLSFDGCRRIRVEGLRLESSGGDGIYLGATGSLPYCEDVVVRDVVCDDNHRQGISVIGAVNLLIENCVLSNTDGTPPQAGIDLEPNGPKEKLVNVVIRNCRMENNTGAGILLYLKNLSRESDPVSVRFEDCYVKGGKDAGIGLGALKDDGPQGSVEFINCTIEDTQKCGAYIYDKSPTVAAARFVNCKWKNVATEDPGNPFRVPILIHSFRKSLTPKLGGVEFTDCCVYDERDRPALVVKCRDEPDAASNLKGTVYVRNPHGARALFPKGVGAPELRVVETHE
jgi:polygalacturonase